MPSIEDAIAAAKASAQTVVIPPPHTQQASLPAAPARKLTMADLNSSSIDVSSWLSVDEFGLRLDKSSEHLETIEAEIDLTEVIPVYMVRYGKNPAQYRKTYDGVTTFGSPKPWEVTLREAQAADTECKGQYSTVELPVTLLHDVKLTKDKKTITAGTRVGYTPSVTGFRPFQKFLIECEKAGKSDGTIKVILGFEVKKSNGNTWGVVTFAAIESN